MKRKEPHIYIEISFTLGSNWISIGIDRRGFYCITGKDKP
jgi:hypothetical protein